MKNFYCAHIFLLIFSLLRFSFLPNSYNILLGALHHAPISQIVHPKELFLYIQLHHKYQSLDSPSSTLTTGILSIEYFSYKNSNEPFGFLIGK